MLHQEQEQRTIRSGVVSLPRYQGGVAMRPLLIAAAALAFPAAALAAPHSNAPISDSLPSPQTIEQGGAALGRRLDGLMQVDVGPLANAIEPSRSHGQQTLGDLARRDDPYFDENLHRSVG